MPSCAPPKTLDERAPCHDHPAHRMVVRERARKRIDRRLVAGEDDLRAVVSDPGDAAAPIDCDDDVSARPSSPRLDQPLKEDVLIRRLLEQRDGIVGVGRAERFESRTGVF
jgi:hypothetical protein